MSADSAPSQAPSEVAPLLRAGAIPAARRLGQLAILLGDYRLRVGVTVVGGVINHCSLILAAGLGGWLVGSALDGGSLPPAGVVWPLLAGLLAAHGMGRFVEVWVEHDVAYRLLADLRLKLYRALERIAPAGLLERRSGDLATLALHDVETLELFFAHTAPTAFVAAIVAVGTLGGLGALDPLLTLALAPWLLGLVVVPCWALRRTAPRAVAVATLRGRAGADALDAVQGLEEILSFVQGPAWAARLHRNDGDLHVAERRLGTAVGDLRFGLTVCAAGGAVSVVAVGADLVASGVLAPALLLAALLVTVTVFPPLLAFLGTVGGALNSVLVAADRLWEVLTAPATVTDRSDVVDLRPRSGEQSPEVRFDRVGFTYPGRAAPALAEVTFTIKPGETVALVGHSGAGKSTCGRLLLRLWDPDDGRILIDGQDVRDVAADDVRSIVGVVPQEVHLFAASVADNIRLGRPGASAEDVRRAARGALAESFIDALPEGFATLLGERGAGLSGGQRQRLAIARALLADKPVLVLDEAVSNLDGPSEQALRAAMGHLAEGRTTLVIAHRLATIRAADRVVVLQDGRVVACGLHDDLVAAGGAYTDLVAAQRTPEHPADPSPAVDRQQRNH